MVRYRWTQVREFHQGVVLDVSSICFMGGLMGYDQSRSNHQPTSTEGMWTLGQVILQERRVNGCGSRFGRTLFDIIGHPPTVPTTSDERDYETSRTKSTHYIFQSELPKDVKHNPRGPPSEVGHFSSMVFLHATMNTSSDDTRPKRKVRKGTHSCWECRRRKVKCVFSSTDDEKCVTCRRRGKKCISQQVLGGFDGEDGDTVWTEAGMDRNGDMTRRDLHSDFIDSHASSTSFSVPSTPAMALKDRSMVGHKVLILMLQLWINKTL